MADLSITAAQVIPGTGARLEHLITKVDKLQVDIDKLDGG